MKMPLWVRLVLYTHMVWYGVRTIGQEVARWKEERRNQIFQACLQRDADERLAKLRAFTRKWTAL